MHKYLHEHSYVCMYIMHVRVCVCEGNKLNVKIRINFVLAHMTHLHIQVHMYEQELAT